MTVTQPTLLAGLSTVFTDSTSPVTPSPFETPLTNDIILVIVSARVYEPYLTDITALWQPMMDGPISAINDFGTVWLMGWWLRVGPGDSYFMPTVNGPLGESGGSHTVAVKVIRGCRTTGNPWETTGTRSSATGSISFPGDTTSTDNDLIFYMEASLQGITSSGYSNPSGLSPIDFHNIYNRDMASGEPDLTGAMLLSEWSAGAAPVSYGVFTMPYTAVANNDGSPTDVPWAGAEFAFVGVETGTVHSGTWNNSGMGSLGVVGGLDFSGVLDLLGEGTTQFDARLTHGGNSVDFGGVGSLTADGGLRLTATLSFLGVGSISYAADLIRYARAIKDHDRPETFRVVKLPSGAPTEQLRHTINDITRIPHLHGSKIANVKFVSGVSRRVPHRLGRPYTGFYTTRANAAAVFFESPPEGTKLDEEIWLTSSADVTVDLWVF